MVIRVGQGDYDPLVYDCWEADTLNGALLSPTPGETLGNSVTSQ